MVLPPFSGLTLFFIGTNLLPLHRILHILKLIFSTHSSHFVASSQHEWGIRVPARNAYIIWLQEFISRFLQMRGSVEFTDQSGISAYLHKYQRLRVEFISCFLHMAFVLHTSI
ncbi:hypothetical protein KC19_5G167800 [Ceratodon purpureus]|uniref:Uncharacterized protein n=1 Tax=Ceratodon purpureus TaxID=3225 RepID=A0A8T0I5A6_CERPU|nr:hypothetical protein KC19_5G167800 [Ceratodon purpureus]